MAPMFSASLPILFNVMDCAGLLVFTGWPPKLRLPAERLRAGAVPAPDSATVCGLPGASSVTTMDADLVPLAVGAKVTVTVQVALTAKVSPQLWLLENCTASLPASAIPLMFNVSLPVLVNVMDCGGLTVFTVWLPKDRLEGDEPRAGAVPPPVRGTVWGAPVASSLMLKVADRPPVPVGENVTVTVQFAFAARLDPQV